MDAAKEKVIFSAGVDFRQNYPKLCYKNAESKEVKYLPLDFEKYKGKTACFQKILSTLKRFGDLEELKMAVVVPDMSEETIELYAKAACEAGCLREQLLFLGESESIVHFVLHQPSEIWYHQVYFLEFGEKMVQAISLQVNRKTVPLLVETSQKESWYVGSIEEGLRDKNLSEIVGERFENQKISSIFLAETDFNPKYYRKSREIICARRRVFLTEQIYARGACLLASKIKERRNYLYLSEQTLLYNVGIRSSRGGKESIYTLLNAGENWYDANRSYEIRLLDEPVLEFVFPSLLGGKPIQRELRLSNLPERPRGVTRILLEISFLSPKQCEIKASDLGFGELYPSSGLVWKEVFCLESEEKSNGAGNNL